VKRPQAFTAPRRPSAGPATGEAGSADAATARSNRTEANERDTNTLRRPRDDRAAEPMRGDHGDAVSPRAVRAARRLRRRVEREEIRRFTRRSRRRRLGWTVGLGSVAALVVGVMAAAYSPLMALTEIRVEGTSRIDAEAVQTAIRPQLGTPLPLVDRDRVAEALEAFPLIQSYSLESLPPGTLVLRIIERAPVGVIESADGFELVDAAGVVIERADAPAQGYPLIEAPGGTSGDGFLAAGSVIRSLPAELRGQLIRVAANTPDDVRLELAGGATVVWGSAEESAMKAVVLTALMTNVPPDSVSEYDVSAPESAVIR
jgi:cell division protein FtsQ